MRPEMLLIAQDALRKDMADRQAYCATSSQARPGGDARSAHGSAMLHTPAWLPARVYVRLAQVLGTGRALSAEIPDSSSSSDDSAASGSRAA